MKTVLTERPADGHSAAPRSLRVGGSSRLVAKHPGGGCLSLVARSLQSNLEGLYTVFAKGESQPTNRTTLRFQVSLKAKSCDYFGVHRIVILIAASYGYLKSSVKAALRIIAFLISEAPPTSFLSPGA